MTKPKLAGDDVAKPGKTPATATSRPVIISKGPAMKDPMVTESSEKPEAVPVVPPSQVKKVIEPLKKADEPATTESAVTEPEPIEETEVTLEGDKGTVSPVDTKQAEEEQKRQELVDKLVAEKKYFVPIGAVQKRNNRIAAILLLVVLLALVGAVAAVDAELIDTNISLPFDLI